MNQAIALVKRLGIDPCLPGDDRPVKRAKETMKRALKKQRSATEALRKLAKLDREIAQRVKNLFAGCPESLALLEARERRHDAKEELDEARTAVRALAVRRKELRAERKQLLESIRQRKAAIKKPRSEKITEPEPEEALTCH